MKKIAFVLFTLLFCNQLSSQTLEQNETDESTGHKIRQTSWETLILKMKLTAYFRISRIDSFYYFDLKMTTGTDKVVAIDKDQEMVFKFENDSVLRLKNLNYAITSTLEGERGFAGSEGQGVKVRYPLSLADIDKLRNNIAIKWKIYTINGHLESNKIADTYFMIPAALKLVCD